jgi:hypothetical protein
VIRLAMLREVKFLDYAGLLDYGIDIVAAS